MWDAVDANSISINRITGEFTALKAGKISGNVNNRQRFNMLFNN